MATKEEIDSMVLLLQFCADTDPRFPEPTPQRVEAWATIMLRRGYGINDLNRGVVEFFASEVNGRMPTPGLILAATRLVVERQREGEPEWRRKFRHDYRRWERDCRIAEARGEECPPQPSEEDYRGV